MRFDAAESFYIPKYNPLKPYGEDAHFFNKAAQVIGVADGVSRDSGEYARELMRHAENAVYYLRPGQVDPTKVLTEASHRTEAPGSSTACIIALAGNKLTAANLGDSGFIVVRKGKTFFKSEAKQHAFDRPYQLGSSDLSVPPEKAEKLKVIVKTGDVVVAGTDGLFSNLYPEEIEEIVKGCMEWSNLAEDLARAAYRKSEGLGGIAARGPFAAAAREQLSGLKKKARRGKFRHDFIYDQFKYKHGYCIHKGGKIDDITVVVACIVPP